MKAFFSALRKVFLRVYCTLDLRSLALFRVLLGVMLLFDVGRRIPGVSIWYTSNGLTPNHTLLWAPVSRWVFSFFFAFSSADEVLVGFFVCACCYLGLLFGFKTRLSTILSTICCVSLHSRVIFLGNGGDEVLDLLCVWSLVLPLGARFSLDALMKKGSAQWGLHKRSGNGFVSLAAFGIICHISVLYFLNYFQKIGELWPQGLTVYYVLFQNHISTPLAVWLRGNMPLELSKILTWGTLAIEGTAPLWILCPFKNYTTRRIGILLLASLHIGIALVMDLGIFSAVMVVYLSLLISARDWECLERFFNRGALPSKRAAISARLTRALNALKLIPPQGPVLSAALRAAMREVLAAIIIVAVGSEILLVNPAIPERFRPPRTALLSAIVSYFRIGQLWVVFPYPPTSDETIVVDALTVTGAHIDPLQYAASGWRGAPFKELPPRLGLDSLWTNYLMRIDDSGMERYRPPLQFWILDHHVRTGNPMDQIVSFHAYVLIQETPPPGVTTIPGIKMVEFMRYPN